MRKAIVGVPQGVGDIFWIYQALYDHFTDIEFKIYLIPEIKISMDVQRRSKDLIKHFPKVSGVHFDFISNAEYQALLKDRWHVPDTVFDYTVREVHFDLCFNTPLEEGKPLESFCRSVPKYNIDLPCEPRIVSDKPYLVLYVSGDTRHLEKVWKFDDWVELVRDIEMPIYLTGAQFDSDVLTSLKVRLQERHEVDLAIGFDGPGLFHLIKNCSYFIGYQSGLNVLADNFDRPQMMLYFDKLDRMGTSWVKPSNRGSLFKYAHFYNKPVDVRKRLNL